MSTTYSEGKEEIHEYTKNKSFRTAERKQR